MESNFYEINELAAIIVIYNPDINILTKCIDSIINEVGSIIIVDNSTNNTNFRLNHKKVHIINNKKNLGIAFAQNQGIKHIITESEAKYILFSDQDSVYSPGSIDLLIKTYKYLESNNYKIASLGTIPIDHLGNRISNKSKVLKTYEINITNKIRKINEVSWHLSSGTLISVNTINKVGLMEENLFIDGVDNEWGWRAKYFHNLPTLVLTDATMKHTFGEEKQDLFPLKYYRLSPFRLFYYFRNSLVLLKREYSDKRWKCLTIALLPLKFILFSFFKSPRLLNMKYIIKGIFASFNYIK